MRATLTEEQQLIVESTERMALGGLENAQQVLRGDPWPAQPDNSLMNDWAGLGLPADRGGDGGGLVDLALAIKAIATTLSPSRFTHHVIALQVADAAGLPLPTHTNGKDHWCLAVSEPNAAPYGPFACQQDGDTLRGRKTGVTHGRSAKLAVVVLANDQVALAEPQQRESVDSADRINDAANLVFDGAAPSALGNGAQTGLLRASALVAAELCGVANGAIGLGADYAKDRIQFGKPIGAFQGVAHQLADALVAAETAWSLTLYACWALDHGTADAAKAVHAAKARASEAAVFCAERALHVHGGMGMTWDAAPHLYLRRALTAAASLGGPHWHRRQVGTALLAQNQHHSSTLGH